MVMVPLLCIFIAPLLTAHQSPPAFLNSANSFPNETFAKLSDPGRQQFVPTSSRSSPGPSLQHTVPRTPEPTLTKTELYVLVDTSQHRLFVKQENRILYSTVVSTGKGTLLVDPRDPNRRWTFETPKGTFTIRQKLKNPIWIRPDWAFIEQGEPIPGQMSDRLLPGVLGAYALGFGDGYFIHGALYTNLLGQDVTHGCIQLHPSALQYVFDTVPLGAPLIII